MSDDARLEKLRAEARHARQRRDLYKAKSYGPRDSDPGRMRELERAWAAAEERLRHAERTRDGEPGG